MFRRLFVTLALVVLALGAALTLAVVLLVEDSPTREWLLLAVAGVVLGGLILAAILSASLAWQITRPLQDLNDAVERVGAGAELARVFPADRDEVSLLGETFNRMSERIGRRIA